LFFDKTDIFFTLEIVLKLPAFGIEATGRQNLATEIHPVLKTVSRKVISVFVNLLQLNHFSRYPGCQSSWGLMLYRYSSFPPQ